MKVYTSIKMQWDGTAYQRVSEQSYEYTGEVAQCCGATSAQNQIQNQQMSLSNEATSQAQSIFGSDSAAYNQLLNTFSPTVQAGPGQNGFSAQETANLDSQAITANGQAAKNAKQAAGEQQAAAGGGNTVLPSGTTAATDANIDTAIAGNTANELSGITQAGYAQGAKNYEEAAQGLEAAPGVFNSATGAIGAATGAGSAASQTASGIAQENTSWVSGVTGALGGIAGAALGGPMGAGIGSSIGKAIGGGGSGPSNDGGYFGG
jgi:hypothetical protein